MKLVILELMLPVYGGMAALMNGDMYTSLQLNGAACLD